MSTAVGQSRRLVSPEEVVPPDAQEKGHHEHVATIFPRFGQVLQAVAEVFLQHGNCRQYVFFLYPDIEDESRYQWLRENSGTGFCWPVLELEISRRKDDYMMKQLTD